MRKIMVTEFITLDGVMEAPNEWSLDYWNDEISRYKYEELFSCGAFLLGRVTYQGFAAAWPSQKNEFADRMNNLPHYVVSTSLQSADWNNSTIIRSNVKDEVARLKQEPGQDIMVAGSATLVNYLLKHGLVDELRLLVYPLILGRGKRLFGSLASPYKMNLTASRSYPNGVLLEVFEAARLAAQAPSTTATG